MSNQLREEAQWRTGKDGVISKYLKEHGELFSTVAARGFTKLPGFASEIEIGLELGAKAGLSELNLKIITETIDRELKQTGLDNDLSYRAAAIAWEVEKQTLMAAWEHEHSTIKQNMAHDEELLNLLLVEVKERGTYLIERKAALELEAEGYRLALASLDGSTAQYEVLLANAKLATARKKLDLIPILLQIVAKETELLEAEEEKTEEYEKLIEAEREVADKKKSDLVPAMGGLINVTEQYADELPKQIATELQIGAEKVLQAGISKEVAVLRGEIGAIGVEIEEEGLDQADLKRDLQVAKNAAEVAIGNQQIEDTRELIDEETGANADILTDERATHTYILDKKRAIDNERISAEKASSTRITGAETQKMDNSTASDAERIRRKAEIDKARKISADLEHIIG